MSRAVFKQFASVKSGEPLTRTIRRHSMAEISSKGEVVRLSKGVMV